LGRWPTGKADAHAKRVTAVRDQRWKLIQPEMNKDGPWQLFDLTNDPEEKRDLSHENPAIVDQFAKQHVSAGWTIDKQEVSLTTLASVCKQHIKENQDIHFLKVDVEGLEEAALRGNDWSTYRPWIVVVEATLPMTQIQSYQEWEPILLNAGYAFAYADGLNRFYVANEHSELLDSFKYPPNVFDTFLLNSHRRVARPPFALRYSG
jgi:FkbM family methyltransferase